MFQNELYLQCCKHIEKVTCRTLPKSHLQLFLGTASQVFEERQKRLLAEVEAERSDGDSRAQRLRQELRRLEQDWHSGNGETEYGGIFFSRDEASASKKTAPPPTKTKTCRIQRQKKTSSHLESVEDGRMLMKSAPVLVLRTVAEISSWPSWRDFDVAKGIGG